MGQLGDRWILWERPQERDLLWPDVLRATPTEVQLGSHYIRVFAVVGFPRQVQPGWFQPLLEFPWPMTMVVFTGPVTDTAVIGEMNRRLTWQQGSQAANARLGRLMDPSQETAIEDAQRLRREVVQGSTKMLDVGLYLSIWTRSRSELDEASAMLEGLATGMLLVIRMLRYQQVQGLALVLPLGRLPLGTREMDSQAWGTLFPLATQDIMHAHGQIWGTHAANQSLVIIDRFQFPSPHSVTIGWSGAGKSYGAKLEALRSRYRGIKVAIIDPEGEYRILARAGATIQTLGDGKHRLPFDPFDIETVAAEELERQIDFMNRLTARLVPGWTVSHQSALGRSIWRIQQQGTVEVHPGHPQTLSWDRVTSEMAKDHHEGAELLQMARHQWQRLAGGAATETDTVIFPDFAVYDLSQVSPRYLGACYLALAEMLSRQTHQQHRRLVIIDEAWHLLSDAETAGYLEELFRRARKWGTALSLITQDFGDFVRNQSAAICLRNAPLVLLLRQHSDSLNALAAELHLHAGELDRISTAAIGEGLLLAGDDHLPIRIWAAPKESELLSHTWRRSQSGGEGSEQP